MFGDRNHRAESNFIRSTGVRSSVLERDWVQPGIYGVPGISTVYWSDYCLLLEGNQSAAHSLKKK